LHAIDDIQVQRENEQQAGECGNPKKGDKSFFGKGFPKGQLDYG